MNSKHLRELAKILGKSWEDFGLLDWEIQSEFWLRYDYVDTMEYFVWIRNSHTNKAEQIYKFLGFGEARNNGTNWIEIVNWENRFQLTETLQDDLERRVANA